MEKLAIILLLISLGLLLIYGIDVMVASQSETDAVKGGGGQGFLPLNEAVPRKYFWRRSRCIIYNRFCAWSKRTEQDNTYPTIYKWRIDHLGVTYSIGYG